MHKKQLLVYALLIMLCNQSYCLEPQACAPNVPPGTTAKRNEDQNKNNKAFLLLAVGACAYSWLHMNHANPLAPYPSIKIDIHSEHHHTSSGVDAWHRHSEKLFASKNLLLMGACMSACAYGGLYLTVSRGNSYLGNTGLWAAWKSHLSLEELVKMPQNELAQLLVTEIQSRYIQANNPTDFVTPFVKFMSDINQEIRLTAYYAKLYDWLVWLRLAAITPVDIQRFALSSAKNQRVSYLKNVFSSWAADYKITPKKQKIDKVVQNKPGFIKRLRSFWNKGLYNKTAAN